MTAEMKAIWAGRSWIIMLVRPSWTTEPFTRVRRRRSPGSKTVSTQGPKGQNES